MNDERQLAHNRMAGSFDHKMNSYDLERRLAVLIDDFLSDVDLRQQLVLDAGCGTGHSAARLAKRGAKPVAMDIGPDLVRMTRRRAPGCLPVIGDVSQSPFKDASFPVVFSTEVIEHTPSPSVAVGECCRVLRVGGRLVLSTPNRAWYWLVRLADLLAVRRYGALENFMTPKALSSAVDDSGCKAIRQVGIHILPFQLSPLRPLIRFIDRWGAILLPVMINQCILAEKRLPGSNR